MGHPPIPQREPSASPPSIFQLDWLTPPKRARVSEVHYGILITTPSFCKTLLPPPFPSFLTPSTLDSSPIPLPRATKSSVCKLSKMFFEKRPLGAGSKLCHSLEMLQNQASTIVYPGLLQIKRRTAQRKVALMKPPSTSSPAPPPGRGYRHLLGMLPVQKGGTPQHFFFLL